MRIFVHRVKEANLVRQRKDTVISAKIARPSISGIAERERLFSLLDRTAAPVVWIAAQAGAGKTMLATSYLDRLKQPCVWYRVDEGDRDAATFFYYLGMAALQAAPRHRTPLPLLTPEYLAGINVFSLRFFESLFGRLKRRVIVFDNYQEAGDEASLNEIVSAGLTMLPPGMRAIVISRKQPPAQFSRLLAEKRMSVIGPEMMRLTSEESRQLVRTAGREDLGEAVIAELHRVTEGWAAGIVLLLHGLNREEILTALRSGSSRDRLFGFFSSEVFRRMSDEQKDFLLRSSCLPLMTAGTAARLTGNANAERILVSLNRDNFFTERRGENDPTYQYHPLFREYLQARLRENLGVEGLRDLQKRAAALLEESGRTEEAASVCRDARDGDALALLIMKHAQSLMHQGRSATLAEWFSGIAPELIDKDPWLLYWQGICQTPVQPLQSRAALDRAFRLFRDRGDAAGTLLAWAGTVNTFMYEWNDFRPLDPLVEWLDGYITANPDFPSPEIETAVSCSMIGALFFRMPERQDRGAWVARALRGSRAMKSPELRSQACFYAFNHYLWAGDVIHCGMMADEYEVQAKKHAAPPVVMINARTLSALYRTWALADHEKALALVSEGAEIADSTGVHVWDHMLYAVGLYAAIGDGDRAGAEKFLLKTEQLAKIMGGFVVAHYHHLASWHHQIFGDTARALTHAETALKLSAEPGASYFEMLCRVKLAVVLHEAGETRKAEEELRLARDMVAKADSASVEFMVLAAEAAFALNAGASAEGLEALRQVMEMGRTRGYVNMFWWWRPEFMARLCAQALENGIEVRYARQLVQKRALMPASPPLHIENWPWPLKVCTLGTFRIEKGGKPVVFTGKIQQKPLDMFKLLTAQGGNDVSDERIMEALWPDADGDTAFQSFETTLHRLRKLLGIDSAIIRSENKIRIDPRKCWIDAWAFDHLLRKAEQRDVSDAFELLVKAIGLYQGNFLANEQERPWMISFRERLRSRFLRAVGAAGGILERNNEWETAATHYQKALEIDDLVEDFYQRLMVCHGRLGRRAEVITVFNRCRKVLSSVVGVEPSSKTLSLYQEMIS